MKTWQITLVVVLFALTANAAGARRICRNSQGRIIGTVTKCGNRSIYRFDTFRSYPGTMCFG